MSSFDSTKISLPSILEDIVTGKIQLPDFQRGWVWDDEHIRSLLVSIARSFPVGAVMLLENGGEARFQTRPIENVDFSGKTPDPERLILDGQQRLTTLTQVLKLANPVKTFNEKHGGIERYYYIDIENALTNDTLDEAFLAVPSDRKIKTDFDRIVTLDLSTSELECKSMYFPCNQILNSDLWEVALHQFAPANFGRYMEFRTKIVNAFRTYQVPVIALGKATSKEAVCLVFEKVNTGGVPLSVFDLMTATLAADNFNLRDDWYGNKRRMVEGREQRLHAKENLHSIQPTDFLQAIALLHTYDGHMADRAAGKTGRAISAVSAKRSAILNLDLRTYEHWSNKAEAGFKLAANFLRREFILDRRDLPYRTQVVPLAAVLTHLQDRWQEPRIYEKLSSGPIKVLAR